MSHSLSLLEQRLTSAATFYRWQRRLLTEWLLEGRIPAAVDVATGLGKTKVMTAWLIARAAGAPLPRRLVYVVDRRAVVDQASAEAERMAIVLREVLADESVDAEWRRHWRANLGLSGEAELAISTLRGQFVDNKKWMDRPHATSIVVGTVDMVGSRLLFSGYGVSSAMRPAHAGLLGCDVLVVLDEAHLVPPFEALLHQIVEQTATDRARTQHVVPPFVLMALSATIRKKGDAGTFRLDHNDVQDPPVRARLSAEKRLRVLPDVGVAQLAEKLAERAWALAEGKRRLLVFCNSRKVAREVESILASRVKREFSGDVRLTELFVGERRFRERTLLYGSPNDPSRGQSIVTRFLPGGDAQGTPAFLVATSAAEVGVDIDADDLVCDLVPWERMVQRFGRVNRRAAPGRARIEIVPSLSEKDSEDDVAAQRLAELRAPFDAPGWPEAADGTRDASPLVLARLKDDPVLAELIARAQSPEPYRPALSAQLVESWAMTTLHDHPGRPIVAPWLRGWIERRPQCSIAWRRYFPIRDDRPSDWKANLSAFFDAAPPHVTEVLEAPADRIAEILKKRAEAWSELKRAAGDAGPNHEPIVVVLDARYELERWLTVAELLQARSDRLLRDIAERTLVVDSRLGGLAESGLLDAKFDDPPLTLDGDEGTWALPLASYGQLRIRWGTRPNKPTGAWHFQGFRWSRDPEDDDAPELWVEVWRGSDATAGDAAVTLRAQRLAEHHEWTREEAAAIADVLGLAPEKKALLCAAAGFHDAGKARDLWQDAMNAVRDEGRPYAKTTGGAAPRMLAGYRHEFGSLADAATNAEISALPDEDRDLALHLIAAHHGRSRPSILAFDPDAAPSRSRSLAQETVLRYTRLQRSWGPWGLAWWEALVRSADWAASRRVNGK